MEYFLGVLVSLIAEAVKRYFGTSTFWTLALIAVLSLFAAAAYQVLQTTGYLALVLQTLTIAGAFHNFVIRRFSNVSVEQ